MTGKERAIAALNLEDIDIVPQTEYCSNWELIRHYTGLDPANPEERAEATDRFARELDFEFQWGTSGEPVHRSKRGRVSDMGHAEFLEGGVDKRETVSLPFQSPEEVLEFDAVEEYGLYDDFDELVQFYQDTHERNWATDAYLKPIGFYHTMISACIDAFGWDMFLTAVGVDPEGFDRVLESFTRLNLQIYTAAAQTDAPYFLCHDDMVWTEGAIFHPDWYRKYLFPKYDRLWAPLKEAGKKILFCSDGDFTEFVPDFIDLGVTALIFEPMTDFEYVCKEYGDRIAIISSKADCRTLTFGTKEQIRAEVE
ncbi:MAG: uroporphyrinogen decarboxylase family protein, partial [Armatimonadota bacterium]